jgi:hypothetical protein
MVKLENLVPKVTFLAIDGSSIISRTSVEDELLHLQNKSGDTKQVI